MLCYAARWPRKGGRAQLIWKTKGLFLGRSWIYVGIRHSKACRRLSLKNNSFFQGQDIKTQTTGETWRAVREEATKVAAYLQVKIHSTLLRQKKKTVQNAVHKKQCVPCRKDPLVRVVKRLTSIIRWLVPRRPAQQVACSKGKQSRFVFRLLRSHLSPAQASRNGAQKYGRTLHKTERQTRDIQKIRR